MNHNQKIYMKNNPRTPARRRPPGKAPLRHPRAVGSRRCRALAGRRPPRPPASRGGHAGAEEAEEGRERRPAGVPCGASVSAARLHRRSWPCPRASSSLHPGRTGRRGFCLCCQAMPARISTAVAEPPSISAAVAERRLPARVAAVGQGRRAPRAPPDGPPAPACLREPERREERREKDSREEMGEDKGKRRRDEEIKTRSSARFFWRGLLVPVGGSARY